MNQEIEIWKDIIAYEGIYQVSNLGRIKSIERVVFRTNNWKYFCRERILKHGTGTGGYQFVGLCKNLKHRSFRVHRLVAIHHIPNLLNLPEVNHKLGDKKDNRACALEWMTTSENELHAFATGLKVSPRGEKQGSSKLKESDVIKIRELLKSKIKGREIAKIFGVIPATISSIKHGKNWAWLQ